VTLGADDLVLCSGTLRREASFRERVDAALAGGFSGISIWARDYRAARESGLCDRDIRMVLGDNGLEIAELDLAWWWLPGAERIRIPPELDELDLFCFGERDLFAIAEAVGARSLNAVDVFGGRWGIPSATESFAALCGRAASHGLLVHLEFLPWSRIPDLETAWTIVRDADQPNGGLAIDSWHLRWKDDLNDTQRPRHEQQVLGGIPADKILSLQLSDAPGVIDRDPPEASLHDRLLPGDGVLDLRGLISCTRRIGAQAPVGIEVFSDTLHALDPVEAGRLAGDAARRILDQPIMRS
jgi:sugar phosphate isomerase/epimerase